MDEKGKPSRIAAEDKPIFRAARSCELFWLEKAIRFHKNCGMAAHAMLVLALAILATGPSLASQSGRLPPKMAVVLPLLRHFFPEDLSEKNIRESMDQILGDDDCTSSRHGPGGAVVDLFYGLDDGEIIHVIFVQDRLIAINREASARVCEVVYRSPAAP